MRHGEKSTPRRTRTRRQLQHAAAKPPSPRPALRRVGVCGRPSLQARYGVGGGDGKALAGESDGDVGKGKRQVASGACRTVALSVRRSPPSIQLPARLTYVAEHRKSATVAPLHSTVLVLLAANEGGMWLNEAALTSVSLAHFG